MCPSRGQNVAARMPSSSSCGTISPASDGVSSREGTPWACWTASASRNISTSPGVIEQEEVAVLMERDPGHELDVLADQRVPALELVQAAERQADVELVRELQAGAARRARGGAARQRLALEQHNVRDAPGGEMEGRAGAHRSPADDHDIRSRRRLAHAPDARRSPAGAGTEPRSSTLRAGVQPREQTCAQWSSPEPAATR